MRTCQLQFTIFNQWSVHTLTISKYHSLSINKDQQKLNLKNKLLEIYYQSRFAYQSEKKVNWKFYNYLI